jgi:signal transduction histidine kinase
MNSDHTSENNTLLNNASNVIAITAHEFKTPLTTITSIVDLLSAKLQADHHMNPFYEKYLSRITSEIFLLNNMLDEMLTINNILSGSIQTKKEIVSVEDLLYPLKEQYRAISEDQKELKITISGTPRKISASPGQITRILTNLISNAFKYAREESPEVHVDYQPDSLLISVKDDGIGIPDTDIPHLFQPYYRGSNTNGIQGTGLGLTIVKTFTTANDGNISVHSVPDKGTVFTLTFRYPDIRQ